MCPREPKQEFVAVKSSECKRRHRSSCCNKGGTNDDGDTALHDAVRYRQPDLVRLKPFKPRPLPQPLLRPKPDRVRLLIEEDPEFTYPANNAGESPLYITAKRGYLEVVSDILKTCRAPAYGGPAGRTALHAAVISNNEGGTKILLDWKKDLANELDVHGWTPLHYAAQFGHVLIKEELEAAGATLGLRNVMSKDNEFLANEKKERAEFKKSIPIDIKKAGDTHLIVATLIATVTFAAGFTMLGGYNSNDAQPKLRHGDSNKRSSFQSFCCNRFHGHDIIHLCCFDLSCFG
ncbi:Espin [Camellia lanceoleosa]|nr:Espin [Camellia lanceoleosa]